MKVLSKFATGDRYSNINLLVRDKDQSDDPIASWSKLVDEALFETHVTQQRKDEIRQNSITMSRLLGQITDVLHTSDTGEETTNLGKASFMTGMFEAVAPYRQFYVIQNIRYWVELLYCLTDVLRPVPGSPHMPHFGEIFGLFNQNDSFIRKKVWDKF